MSAPASGCYRVRLARGEPLRRAAGVLPVDYLQWVTSGYRQPLRPARSLFTMPSALTDPRELYAKPPFDQPEIQPPGLEGEMAPACDHGDSTYPCGTRLAGRRALITGADSGIGRAVAIAFAREGASIAMSYLREEEEDALETATFVKDAGQQAILLPGDVASPDHCRRLIDLTTHGLGGIDLLVNNAAHQRTFKTLAEIPEGEFERTFQVNVFATFYLCQAALPKMPAGGSIINTVSIQSFDPGENLLAYAASKSAIASLTKSMAPLAMERGVRINAVAPGPVWTPLIPSTMPAERTKTFGGHTLFKRPAQPAELAPVYVFLASSGASFVTGEIYGVTGGQMQI